MRAHVWVTDPKVEQVNDSKPLRDTDILRVRSVDGVSWAAALYLGNNQARLNDGTFKFISLVGLDSTTLAGAPAEIVEGKLEDLRLPNSVILDQFGVERFSEGRDKPIGVGDVFEINDREARIVGICRSVRAFTGGPFVFTTYDRIPDYVRGQRRLLSFVLVEPAPGVTDIEAARRIERETGLRAYTRDEFMWSTIWWFVANTGIPINIALIVFIGFVVGVAVSGQTFYSFVLENTRNLAALMAMGASTRTLCLMLLVQSLAVSLIGYGIGLGLVTLIGSAVLSLGKVPFLLLWQLPVATLAAVIFISILSAVLGIWRIARLEPAVVFR